MRLAVLILTMNEEKNIADCIDSASFADEVIIIDSGSTDGTERIARAMGARFASHPMDEDGFAGQRNFALTRTDAEWVLYLDADERLGKAAAGEIREAMKEAPAAWEIRRINYVYGHRMLYGAHRPDWSLRLYPRGAVHWKGVVHEQAEVTVPIRRLKETMRHYSYSDVAHHLAKINRYTTLGAKHLYERGKRSGLSGIVLHPLFMCFKMFILKQGFRDGFWGLLMSMMAGVDVFIKYLKLYEMQTKE